MDESIKCMPIRAIKWSDTALRSHYKYKIWISRQQRKKPSINITSPSSPARCVNTLAWKSWTSNSNKKDFPNLCDRFTTDEAATLHFRAQPTFKDSHFFGGSRGLPPQKSILSFHSLLYTRYDKAAEMTNKGTRGCYAGAVIQVPRDGVHTRNFPFAPPTPLFLPPKTHSRFDWNSVKPQKLVKRFRGRFRAINYQATRPGSERASERAPGKWMKKGPRAQVEESERRKECRDTER